VREGHEAGVSWNIDVEATRTQLDMDHHGLEVVKRRILEYVAVASLKKDLKGPVLCLVGPPGVGKTSLGASIAKALGRKFTRLALGGVSDEAEIRGHRRTYIGAMLGSLLQAVKRVATRDCVVLLDEVDKLGLAGRRGDPSSALLEVLDPEQNNAFLDHYLNLPFDLSACVFIATANNLDTIPPPLLDRLEIIEVGGYTTEEKVVIASQHLVPRQLVAHGLVARDLELPPPSLEHVATAYTREAGVRDLERKVAALCRSVAVDLATWRRNQAQGKTKKGARFPRALLDIEAVDQILGGGALRSRRRQHRGDRGRGHRPRLDTDRWGTAVHRVCSGPRHRAGAAHRAARGRDEGECDDSHDLDPLQRSGPRCGLQSLMHGTPAEPLPVPGPEQGRPSAPSGRGHSEGRAFGRCGDCCYPRVSAHEHSHGPGRGHDWRD
jgi:ATP-dependent Lon protease